MAKTCALCSSCSTYVWLSIARTRTTVRGKDLANSKSSKTTVSQVISSYCGCPVCNIQPTKCRAKLPQDNQNTSHKVGQDGTVCRSLEMQQRWHAGTTLRIWISQRCQSQHEHYQQPMGHHTVTLTSCMHQWWNEDYQSLPSCGSSRQRFKCLPESSSQTRRHQLSSPVWEQLSTCIIELH